MSLAVQVLRLLLFLSISAVLTLLGKSRCTDIETVFYEISVCIFYNHQIGIYYAEDLGLGQNGK